MDILIHGKSFCSIPHKIVAFDSFIYRLVSLPPFPSTFANEVSILKQLATVNMIDVDIDGLIGRRRMKVSLQRTNIFTLTPRTYFSKMSHNLEKITYPVIHTLI